MKTRIYATPAVKGLNLFNRGLNRSRWERIKYVLKHKDWQMLRLNLNKDE